MSRLREKSVHENTPVLNRSNNTNNIINSKVSIAQVVEGTNDQSIQEVNGTQACTQIPKPATESDKLKSIMVQLMSQC